VGKSAISKRGFHTSHPVVGCASMRRRGEVRFLPFWYFISLMAFRVHILP
jgi:hypothetical protein